MLVKVLDVVRLLMGYHSNADNKVIDDYKTNISVEGKHETKIGNKKVSEACLSE